MFAGLGGGVLVGTYVSDVWENYKNQVLSLEINRDSQISDANLAYQRATKTAIRSCLIRTDLDWKI